MKEISGIDHFWFLSFGDKRLKKAACRIGRQARAMKVFGNRICIWNEDDLDKDFRALFKDHLISGSRGYGYWCWKPQIILSLLRRIPEGDVVLYADVGCHFNPRGRQRLVEYYELAKKHDIVCFQARSFGENAKHFLLEKLWTKADLISYFKANEPKIVETGQIGSGIIIFCKNDFTVSFFEKFLGIYKDDFSLCDDSESRLPNDNSFVENRHDQSVFSLMCKKYGIFSLSCAEYTPIREFMPKGGNPYEWPDSWHQLRSFPIWAKHDILGRRIFGSDLIRRAFSYELRHKILDKIQIIKKHFKDETL